MASLHRTPAMLALVSIIGFFAASSSRGQDLSNLHNIGGDILGAQKKAVSAADHYAAAVAPVRDTAEYSATFRALLNHAYPRAVQSSPAAVQELAKLTNSATAIYGGTPVGGATVPPTVASLDLAPNTFDADPRYRSNLVFLTRGRGSDEDRVWGGLPTSGYANTVVIVGGTRLCTGTVVGPNAILTAQHCYCEHVDEKAYVTNVYDDQMPSYAIVRGVPMKPCGSASATAADVALMFTDTNFAPNVAPPIFASSAMIDGAHVVRAVGFGRTETGKVGQKMMVDVPVVSTACSGSVGGAAGPMADADYYGCNPSFELVAADPLLAKDTCNGDSGGPIFVRDGQGHDYLAAATSRVVTLRGRQATCGPGGVYVRVDGQVASWIAAQGIVIRSPS